MAKNGQKIEELYVSLGMDITGLDADLALADKTVSQGLAELNRKKNNIRIRADIDTDNLEGADTAVQKLAIRERSLNGQLALQKQRVELMDAAYRQSVHAVGSAAAASQKLETRLLQERRAYSQLEAQIRRTATLQSQQKAGQGMFGSLFGGAGGALAEARNAKDSVAGALGGLSGMAGKIGAAYAFVEAGAGLMNVTRGAMQAGDSIYKLSQRMHISTEEAARMNAMFTLAGADAVEATPALTRLDRAVLNAGVNGNDTTKALARFGVSLTDSTGRLLPMNEQLQALAQGYKRAAASGQEEAFAAEVLGRNGQALIPVLADIDELTEATADIETTGLLSPRDCHELSVTWKKMQAESNQLKLALGAALVPVAVEVMPDLIALAKDLIGVIRDNRENIKYLAGAFIAMAKVSIDGLKGVLDFLGRIGVNAENVRLLIEHLIYSVDTLAKVKDLLKAGDFAGASAALDNAGFGKWRAQRDEQKQAEEEAKKAAGEAKQARQEQDGSIQQVAQSAKEEEEAAKKAADAEKKAAEEAAKANQELADTIYEQTHSQLDLSLRRVDTDSDKYRSRGADEDRVTEEAERAKAKIRQDFEENVAARIDAVWKSSLQNRLDDIEREKRAYIQKGIDEVKATAWAEHEKRMAQQKEALAALKENREYLDIMRQALAGEGTMEEKTLKARTAMLIHMREKTGVSSADRTSPQEMAMFSQLMGDVRQNLVPGLETGGWAKLMDRNSVQVFRGTKEYRDVPGVTINIHADFKDAYIDSEAAENRLADKLGTRMTPKVAGELGRILGGGSNSY